MYSESSYYHPVSNTQIYQSMFVSFTSSIFLFSDFFSKFLFFCVSNTSVTDITETCILIKIDIFRMNLLSLQHIFDITIDKFSSRKRGVVLESDKSLDIIYMYIYIDHDDLVCISISKVFILHWSDHYPHNFQSTCDPLITNFTRMTTGYTNISDLWIEHGYHNLPRNTINDHLFVSFYRSCTSLHFVV